MNSEPNTTLDTDPSCCNNPGATKGYCGCHQRSALALQRANPGPTRGLRPALLAASRTICCRNNTARVLSSVPPTQQREQQQQQQQQLLTFQPDSNSYSQL
uniref:Uncharacterized protein n=1 Tax=Eutreptiella gymnastica TaxID=73025 RepID=A0A7S4CSY9_9EUGL